MPVTSDQGPPDLQPGVRKILEGADPATTMPRWFGANRTASIAFAERFHANPVQPTLFHYTSSAALISILRNNELWLSDATFLNDRVEIEHGRKIACERIRAAMAVDPRADVKEMLASALAKFTDEPDPIVYVACFSLEGDDLAQWRGYGRGDAPIAIELEHGPLMFGYTSEGELHMVLYDPTEQAWAFDQMLEAYIAAYAEDVLLPRPSLRVDPITPEEEREMCANSLYYGLWRYIVACKDPSFASEREVRFTYTAHDYGRMREGWHPEHPAASFREAGGRIVPYLSSRNLDFRNMKRVREAPTLPIVSVRVGPMDDQWTIARGVRRLLDAYDHRNAAVTLSGTPFRG
ncbi:MAG TPA: DUF2971 domain-containing protein [Allosphingosinicella sp.]|jgi:hypothetical protein